MNWTQKLLAYCVYIVYRIIAALIIIKFKMEQVCYYDRAVAIAVAADSFSAGIIIIKLCLFYLRLKRVIIWWI